MDHALPELVADFQKYVRMDVSYKDTGLVDLANVTFFHPTHLLPTLSYLNKVPRHQVAMPRDSRAKGYLEHMMSGDRHDASESYIPMVEIPRNICDFGSMFNRICNLGGKYGGKESFRLMIGELTDNIYQHSGFSNAWAMGQSYPGRGTMEFCIMDDGMTIPGSLNKAGIIVDDGDALKMAVEGLSAKQDHGRGFGLGTSIQTLTKDYCACVMIASGLGILHFNQENQKCFILRESSRFNGTLIRIKMPIR